MTKRVAPSDFPVCARALPRPPQESYEPVRSWFHLTAQERQRSEVEQTTIDIAAGR